MVDYKLKICFFEHSDNWVSDCINCSNLEGLGIETFIVNGTIQDLLSHMSKRSCDIFVVNLNRINQERFSYAIDIIYDNFCKNIIIISDASDVKDFCDERTGCSYLNSIDKVNFDLKLEAQLMNMKRDIQSAPSKNITLLKSKVYEMLDMFQFSNRHDGFKYYLDAIVLAYLELPYNYSTMNLYKQVADRYGKTIYAVEKSMRMALMHAFNKLKSAPLTPENNKLKSYLTYDLNNNTAIGMMLGRLVLDQDIKNEIRI